MAILHLKVSLLHDTLPDTPVGIKTMFRYSPREFPIYLDYIIFLSLIHTTAVCISLARLKIH